MMLNTLEGSKDSTACADCDGEPDFYTSQETVEEGAVELLGDHLVISGCCSC